MKFTILGASGYIGRHLCEALAAQGFDVFAPRRNDPRIFTEPLGHVIYAIGLTADFRSKPFDTVAAHVSVLADVLQKANFSSLLYLSSTRVYSGAAETSELTSFSVSPKNPSDLYNISKLMGESLCLNSGRRNVKIARLSNVVGEENPGSELFFYALLQEARQGKVTLRTHPDSSKDYIALNDVLNILPRIAQQGKASIYNVASGRNISNGELIKSLALLTKCQVEIMADAPLYDFMPIDVTLLRQEFGFHSCSIFDVLPTFVDLN
jgi:nucleoside-diphosphate-sugar epimerase